MLLSLLTLCFSASFFPALHLSIGTPHLSVAIIASLAMLEGVKYASFFAVILGGAEGFIFGESPLVYILFHLGFAFLCITLFGSFFTKSYFALTLYTVGGILLRAALGLFGPVANWDISAADIFLGGTLQSILLSMLFSLLIFPTVSKIKKKTE